MPRAEPEPPCAPRRCGVCHTDLHCIKGEVPFPQPAVFGHEICGEVVRYGPLPADAAAARGGGAGTPAGATPHPLPAGTKVISPFIMPCGSCAFCHKGEEDTCETLARTLTLTLTLARGP